MLQTVLTILGISVILSVPTSMIVLGIESGRSYLKELFGKPALLAKYIIVMFILMPALAFVFYFIDVGNHTIWIAVIVISIAPVAPGMIKGITKLGGNTNLSTAWLVSAIFISIIMIPVNLLIMEQILNVDINLGIGAVVFKLMLMFVIPLLVGFFIKKYLPALAHSLKKILEIISKLATLVMVVCLLLIAVPMLIEKGSAHFLLIFLFLLIALAITHFIEASDRKYGPILSYSVILRLPAPALVLASINGTTKIYAPEILSFVLIGLIVMAIYNKIFYGKEKSGPIASI